MDKRFILMFFIILVCAFNLFFIVEYSDVIGSASVDVSNYTFSIPKNFILLNSNSQDSVSIYNTNTGLHIMVSVIPHYNSSFKLNQIKDNENYTVLSNGTINDGNITIKSIYYKYLNRDNNKSSAAIFYFNKNNALFKISMDNFNYQTQRNETIDSLTYIVESLRINNMKL